MVIISVSLSAQASGEAQYISDMLPQANELAAAFVITTQVTQW